MDRSVAAARRRGVHGFTLVEIIVAVGIIMVLYGILLPVLAAARQRARETECASNLHQMGLALRMYHDDYGEYPVFSQLDAMVPQYVTLPAIAICPMEYRDLATLDASSEGNKMKYVSSFLWPCTPSPMRDQAMARRGEMTPLLVCDVHTIVSSGTPFHLVLRAGGSVQRRLVDPNHLTITTLEL